MIVSEMAALQRSQWSFSQAFHNAYPVYYSALPCLYTIGGVPWAWFPAWSHDQAAAVS
jgi:hypothetical protein